MQKKGLGSIPSKLKWIEDIAQEPSETIETSSAAQESKSNLVQTNDKSWTRATFIIDKNLLQQLKAHAYWDRLTIREALEGALLGYLKNKQINSLPIKKQKLA